MLVLAGTGVLSGVVTVFMQSSFYQFDGVDTFVYTVSFIAGTLLLGCAAIVGFRYTTWHLIAAAVSGVMAIVSAATLIVSLLSSRPAPLGLAITAAAYFAVGIAALLALRAMKQGKQSPAAVPLAIAIGAACVNALASLASTLSFGWSSYDDPGSFVLSTVPLLLPPIVILAIVVLGVLPSRVTRIIAGALAALMAASVAVQSIASAASEFGRIMLAGNLIDVLGWLATATLLIIAGALTKRRVTGVR